jgi:DnaK suppressor protein
MKQTQTAPARRRTVSRRSLLRYFDKESRRLERTIREQQELIKLPGATRGELLDEASEITEQAQSIAVLEQLNKEWAQVQAARQKLLEGQYGICQDCGRPIPRARLMALPYATLCVRCQTLRGPRNEAA